MWRAWQENHPNTKILRNVIDRENYVPYDLYYILILLVICAFFELKFMYN